ncbi:MAG TPA: Hpt domain-containing protein, partial [Pyrinomonadaceae bacterium]|nr:Hpt domain-containing protein [Pyrinomonadaceae bacterium]
MQTLTRQSFLEKAEDRLAGIRGSLLLFAQGRLSPGDLVHADRRLEELGTEAKISGLDVAACLADDCSQSLEILASSDSSNRDAYVNRSLDLLSRLEAELLQMPLASNDFLSDVNDLVESSFEHFKRRSHIPTPAQFVPEPEEEDFEIDEETLEIFRSEAEGLLANISSNLRSLGRVPDDTNALWEIRRNAHTFKGAAGIIGFRDASQLAHRIEDLLDKMVESRC